MEWGEFQIATGDLCPKLEESREKPLEYLVHKDPTPGKRADRINSGAQLPRRPHFGQVDASALQRWLFA
jgi:hypothetical protein